MTDGHKPPSRKRRIAVATVSITIGFVLPIFILAALTLNIGSVNQLHSVDIMWITAPILLILFTVNIVAVAIFKKTGDRDNMSHWLDKPPASVVLMIAAGSITAAAFMFVIDWHDVSESTMILINNTRATLVALSVGAILLLIAMWFSHKDMQELRSRLDHIDEGLFDTHEDEDGNKTHTSKFDRPGDGGQE